VEENYLNTFRILFVVSLELIAVPVESTKQVECEKFESYDFHHIGAQETCYMNKTTSIDSPDTTISSARDTRVGGIEMDRNKQIQFLPVEIYKSFPNLVVLWADSCSIKAITKDNFKNLEQLRLIGMSFNLITTIPSDAFKGLESLERLYLGE